MHMAFSNFDFFFYFFIINISIFLLLLHIFIVLSVSVSFTEKFMTNADSSFKKESFNLQLQVSLMAFDRIDAFLQHNALKVYIT